MIMKYTEGNDIQEKPIFAIENDENSTSSQELHDEPTIIIESSGEMEHNTSSDSIKNRGWLPKWSLAHVVCGNGGACIRLLQSHTPLQLLL